MLLIFDKRHLKRTEQRVFPPFIYWIQVCHVWFAAARKAISQIKLLKLLQKCFNSRETAFLSETLWLLQLLHKSLWVFQGGYGFLPYNPLGRKQPLILGTCIEIMSRKIHLGISKNCYVIIMTGCKEILLRAKVTFSWIRCYILQDIGLRTFL